MLEPLKIYLAGPNVDPQITPVPSAGATGQAQINADPPAMQASPPAEPLCHRKSPSGRQSEAAGGTSGQVKK